MTSRPPNDPIAFLISPREVSGSQTGARYEFQYHQAAADSLTLLDDRTRSHLYCEWYDDYVIESVEGSKYSFFQIKSRLTSRSALTIAHFFGIPRKAKNAPAPASRTDSIFARMWDHVTRLGSQCEGFVLVSDSDPSAELEALIEDVKICNSFESLSKERQAEISSLVGSISQSIANVSERGLFEFIQKLFTRSAIGRPDQLSNCRAAIGARIFELSEVDLLQSESNRITENLVALVREKSHNVPRSAPKSIEELRALKGLGIDDVLKLLSLSPSGYRELKQHGRAGVVTLSRLHRLLKANNIRDDEIMEFCRAKATWDSWYVAERHTFEQTLFISLRLECANLLESHVQRRISLNELIASCPEIANRWRATLTTRDPLTGDHVLGLVLTVAAERADA